MSKSAKSWIPFFTAIYCTLCTAYFALANDPQLTQFYSAPLYLNPAFAGTTPCWRIGANYRNQWFLSDKPYTTYMVSLDYNLASSTRINGGVGGYIYYDNPGAGSYSTFEFAPIFAYEIRLNEKSQLRFGLQPSYQQKTGGFNASFAYGSQLTNLQGQTGTGITDNVNMPASLSFFDLSSGIVLYSEKYWLGFAANHILRNPLILDTKTNPVPMKLSLHGGMKIELNDYWNAVITPAFNIRNQGAAFQADIGFYYEVKSLVLGAWYRGIPILTGQGLNTDALAFLIGFQKNSFKVGYSYDLPVSRMINSFGTHEISLAYEFCMFNSQKQRPPRNVRQLPCPKY